MRPHPAAHPHKPLIRKYPPRECQAVMSLYKIHRSYSFVPICGRFRKHRGPPSLAAFTEWKTVTILFLALCRYTADCPPEDVYSTITNDKRRSYTLISEGMVSLADSLFKFPFLPPSRFLDPLVLAFDRHREVIASSASKSTSLAAEQRALLVFPARNSSFETSLRDDF